MFKALLTTALVIFLTYPAWAEPGHSTKNHDQPRLRITPITPNILKAGESNKVVLFIQDKQANPINISQFKVIHTQPVHLLIIDPELKDYHHEHPTQHTTGQYTFSLTPQTACSYRVWADVQLKGSHQHYIPVDLKGSKKCHVSPDKTVNLESSSQGYDFKLKLEGDLKVDEAFFANMSITKDGKPVDFLEPVMGAFTHMVGFYEDYQSIAHIHPMGKEPAKNTERGGPTLRFHIEPQHAGYLKLFAQVQIDEKKIFAPFGILISE